MKICPNCNIELDDKFVFCNQCGSRLLEKIEICFCPYCGKKMETEGMFCPYCGNSISDEQSDTIAAPVSVSQNSSMNRTQQDPVSSNTQPFQEREKTGSTFAAILKFIFYIIGGFFLFFVMKVLTKGMVKSFMRDGFSLSFVVCGVIVALICYFFLYRNKE